MLLAPIGRSEIALGKLSALAVLSAISAVIYTGSMVASVPVMMSAVGASRYFCVKLFCQFLNRTDNYAIAYNGNYGTDVCSISKVQLLFCKIC